jgi:hypothetical protein
MRLQKIKNYIQVENLEQYMGIFTLFAEAYHCIIDIRTFIHSFIDEI